MSASCPDCGGLANNGVSPVYCSTCSPKPEATPKKVSRAKADPEAQAPATSSLDHGGDGDSDPALD